jgi:hypothetical protein
MGLFSSMIKCASCGFINDRGTYDCVECHVPFSDNGQDADRVERDGPSLFGKRTKPAKKRGFWG